MTINRRELFTHSRNWLLGLTLSQLFPGLSLIAPAEALGDSLDWEARSNHFFVLLKTFGGMDTTLGLDPYVMPPGADAQDIFIEYRPDEILQAGNLRLGPSAKELLPHAGDCVVINGVMMRRDAGHDVINLYMATGRGDGKAAALPVELALSLGSGPYGVLMNSNIYLAGKAMSLSSTGDILADTDPTVLLSLIEKHVKHFDTGKNSPFEIAQKNIVGGKDATANMVKLLKQFQVESGKLDDRQVVAAAFAAGAAQQAQLDAPMLGLGLDTHSAHEGNHLRIQAGVWKWVAEVFALFKKVPFKEEAFSTRQHSW